ncbi:cytochrome P450 [Mycena galopus ATCC 62051]|nr:cytochrome P450 [Mycena galopus ATCC 62051]
MVLLDHPTITAVCAGLGWLLYGLHLRKNRGKLPLPPGPTKFPLVGINPFIISPTHPWETYMAWSKKYQTDILHLDLAGTSVIILSSLKAADALFEKRSSIYSDGPQFTMLELMGWVPLIFGNEWRAHRRLFSQRFATASPEHRATQLVARHALLRRLLYTPDKFMQHFRHEIMISVTYGIDVGLNDPFVSSVYEAADILSYAGVPGRYLDSLPILKYVPSWFPGAQFKRDVKAWRKLSQRLADELGIARPSFTPDNLNALKDSEDDYYTEGTVRATARTTYVAGTDTTVSALGSFIFGMLSNKDAQRKTQAEIDSVTQGKCLPDFTDEEAMPYITAVVKETLSWKNVGPLAIPHFLAVEDEYEGYRIPANSIVIGNTWAILHDEAVYSDPYVFKPERFLGDDGLINPAVPDPQVAFGYGWRFCPGRQMATASLWITIASILATFEITKALDGNGREIGPSYEFGFGFINAPLPFKCSIRPRSQQSADLIQAGGDEEGRV